MIEVLSLTISSVLVCLALANLWLISFHVWHRDRMIENEKLALRRPILSSQGYPNVCVQLPVRNEERVVRDALRSLCALHWPRDRLEIMVLDDQSTDRTVAIAQEEAATGAARGVTVKVIGS